MIGAAPHRGSAAREGAAHSADRDVRALLAVLAPAALPAGLTGECASVEVDSRRVSPGSIFVAVPGEDRDGAAYAADAGSRGALVVVAEHPLDAGVPVVVVPDARAAAADLAAAFHGRPAEALALVGVTGTNGKTTTCFLLRHLLRAAGRTCGMLGTTGHFIGDREIPAANTTPGPVVLHGLLAKMRDAACTHGVMEVSSHALVQGRTRGVPFDVAIFTNLTGDHLDYHGTIEAYRDAKGLLFEGLEPGAMAVLNADDPVSEDYARRTRAMVKTYGFGADVDVGCEELQLGSEGAHFVLRVGEERVEVASPLLGRHNVANLLAAAAGAHGLGLPVSSLTPGLTSFPGVPGRLERVDGTVQGRNDDFRVVVDYAHTEDALRRVLENLRPVTPGRLIVVGGCGGDRDRTKRPRMARAMAELADLAIFTSDNPRTEDPAAILAEMSAGVPDAGHVEVVADRRTAIGEAVARARTGDTVLIAGKGHETYQVLRSGTIPFDDREEARAALQRLRGRPPS